MKVVIVVFIVLIKQISITEDNIGTVINNLTVVVMTTNETADQNEDNLQVVRTALTQTATLLQNVSSVPLAVVEEVGHIHKCTLVLCLTEGPMYTKQI